MSSMRSTFFGLEIGRTGLFVSQRQLDVTGHNIANVETLGYTRQRAATAAIDPYSVIMRYKPMENGRVGGGVQILHVEQIRDKFLDRQIRDKNSDAFQWDARAAALYDIESLFDELRTTGLNQMLANFMDSIQTVHTNEELYSIRINMQQTGKALASKFNEYYDDLIRQQGDLDKQYEAITAQINSIAENIAQYNERIFGYELTGEFANDLRDKRNLLLDELSQLVDINYYEVGSSVPGTPGKLVVEIGGQKLVDYKTVTNVRADSTKTNPIAGEPTLFELYWDDGATPPNKVNYTSGKLKGIELMRDSSDKDVMGIPYMVQQLNALANALVNTINRQHEQGWTYPYTDMVTGTVYPSVTGILFFDQTETSPGVWENVTAKNIRLSDEVFESAYNVAMSSKEIDFLNADNQSGNRENGLLLAKWASDNSVVGGTSFEGFLAGVVVALGVNADYANKAVLAAENVCVMLENQRMSISGVSLDEEMTNMITFQHAYNGAARVITVMDEALDKLINGTGRVGL